MRLIRHIDSGNSRLCAYINSDIFVWIGSSKSGTQVRFAGVHLSIRQYLIQVEKNEGYSKPLR
jgi:hypothetical protein